MWRREWTWLPFFSLFRFPSSGLRAEFAQVPTRVVAALGLGARGLPEDMALAALVGPQSNGELLLNAQTGLELLDKRLRGAQAQRAAATKAAPLTTADLPSVGIPLSALAEVFSVGWGALVRQGTIADSQLLASYRPRPDAPLALVEALRALDDYRANHARALQRATAAVAERLELLERHHVLQLDELLMADKAGQINVELRGEVRKETLAEWQTKHNPAHAGIDGKKWKLFEDVEKRLVGRAALERLLRMNISVHAMQDMEEDLLHRVSQLVLAMVANKQKLILDELDRLGSAVARVVNATAHNETQLDDRAAQIPAPVAVQVMRSLLSLYAQATQLNEMESDFFVASEALVGAYLELDNVSMRRLLKDAITLRSQLALEPESAQRFDRHLESMDLLPRLLAHRVASMLQTAFDKSPVTRVASAVHPRVRYEGHNSTNTDELPTLEFDRSAALDAPALQQMASLALDVSSACVEMKELQLANAAAALSGVLRGILNSLQHSTMHRLGQSDLDQLHALSRVLREDEFEVSNNDAKHPQYPRLVQELQKLRGGLYGGVPSLKQSARDGLPMQREVDQMLTAQAAADMARAAGGTAGATLLEAARDLPLSLVPATPDALATDSKNTHVLKGYAFGVVYQVRHLWRSDRYIAAATAATELATMAKRVGSPELAEQTQKVASRIWAVANAHKTKESGNAVYGAHRGHGHGAEMDDELRDPHRVELEGEVEVDEPRRLAHLMLKHQEDTLRDGAVPRAMANGVNLLMRGNKFDGTAVLLDQEEGALQLRRGRVHPLPGLSGSDSILRSVARVARDPVHDWEEPLEAVGNVVGGEVGRMMQHEAGEWSRVHRQHMPLKNAMDLTEYAEDRIRSATRIARFRHCTNPASFAKFNFDECGHLLPVLCRVMLVDMTPEQRSTLCGVPRQ